MDLHVFPIPIPPPTSLSIPSLGLEHFEHRFDVIRLDQQEKVFVSLEVRQKGALLDTWKSAVYQAMKPVQLRDDNLD